MLRNTFFVPAGTNSSHLSPDIILFLILVPDNIFLSCRRIVETFDILEHIDVVISSLEKTRSYFGTI